MVRDTLETDNWREGTKTRGLYTNLQVMILDGHEEGEQRLLVDLECVTQAPLLEYLEGGGSQHAGVTDGAASGEHVQAPGVNINLVLNIGII